MSHATGDSNLARFLEHGRRAIQQAQGINDQSLTVLADLAARFNLAPEEVEAAGAQLGLSESEIHHLLQDAGLEEAGGSTALRWILVLGCFAILLGVGGGAVVYVMKLRQDSSTQNQPVAQNQPVTQKEDTPRRDTPINPGQNGGTNPDGQVTPVSPGPTTNGNPPPTPPSPNPGQNGTTNPGPPMTPTISKYLADQELLATVVRLQTQMPTEQAILEKLKLSDLTERQQGWKQFLPRITDPAAPKSQIKLLLVSYHAKEDQDENAQLIREQLLQMLPPQVLIVPDKAAAVYDNAFWAVEVCAEALQHPALSSGRKEKLRTTLENVLNIKLEVDQPAQEVKKQGSAALAELFFGDLIQTAKKEPARVTNLQPVLLAKTLPHLGLDKQNDLLQKLKEALGETKPAVNPDPMPNPKPPEPSPKTADPRAEKLAGLTTVLLQKPTPSPKEPVTLLQDTVTLTYAATLAAALAHKQETKFDELAGNPPSLGNYLSKIKPAENPRPPNAPAPNNPAMPPQPNPGGPSLPNPGVMPGGGAGVGGGGAFGAIGFMGGSSPLPGGMQGAPPNLGGGAGFAGGAVGFGGGPALPGGGDVGAAPFSFAGVPGAAIAGNPGGVMPNPGAGIAGNIAGGFVGNPGAGIAGNPGGVPPPPNPKPAAPNPGPAASPLSGPENLAVALKLLKTNVANARYSSLEFIAQQYQGPDLVPSEAEVIAEYLLNMTNTKEFEAVVPLIPKLGRFQTVHLALADLLDDGVLVQPSRVEIILAALTGKQPNLAKEINWRPQAKIVLLQSALATGPTLPEGDAAQLILRDLYQKQAAVVGLDTTEELAKPSAVLERIIKQVATKVQERVDLSDDNKTFLKGIPQQLEAAKFLSFGNDVQHLVLLQRLWLTLLGERLALEQPAKAKQARELSLALDAQCREQSSALAQMWLCDQHLLRMWLLYLDIPTK